MLTAKKSGESKGQLLSYYWEEKTTEYLCLYSSKFNGEAIIFDQLIVPVMDEWNSLSNKKELYDYWNKTFKKNGIFEPHVKPYNVECKALLRSELDRMTDEDSSRIFNQFLEILRHNAVSDKPNAFNKILNLFICKIIDEDRSFEEELVFQWKEDSTHVSLQSGLEDLYKQGMGRFLDIEVTDYSESEIEQSLSGALLDEETKSVITKMFQDLRLQKNPVFAFKEIYNEESFHENAKVLKEIVELLQPYQFRYGHKQQFLGNFFEQLLNTSIKQESGQFFTPVPIARFMISSLPIKETIDNNIALNNKSILPTALDYACGSGHFLTEYMDIVQLIINDYDTSTLRKSTKDTIDKWKQTDDEDAIQGQFEWANDYVYGIENDYRLVKTTKISTFLNGDGEANVIHADGLDKFSSSKYYGLLSAGSNKNNSFNYIIANPPYSVSAFKQTLKADDNDFETYKYLTKSSSEIECLFVERTAQLLKDGGCAAIILPSSILSNSSLLHEKTREILLKNFYIKAIVKMGSNTFMATGTSTVILFLEKRAHSDFIKIKNLIDRFFGDYKDFNFRGMTKVVEKYVEKVLEDVNLDDYVSYIKGNSNLMFSDTEYYSIIRKSFLSSNIYKDLVKKKLYKDLPIYDKEKAVKSIEIDFIQEIEKQKLSYYLLTFDSKTLLIKTGEKEKEKEFLGYEFSNRRGNEGIHYYVDENGNINSSLYNEEEISDDDSKVNYYIHRAYTNDDFKIADDLAKNIKNVSSFSLLNFNTPKVDLSISLNPPFKITLETKAEKFYLRNVCQIQNGTTITEKNVVPGSIPVVAGGKELAYYHNEHNRDGNIITVSSSGANAGYLNYWVEPIYASDCTTIHSKDESNLLTQYVYVLLKSHQEELYILQKGQGQPHVYGDDLGDIKIPIPSLDVQVKIVDEYFSNITQMKNLGFKMDENIGTIDTIINNIEGDFKLLNDYALVSGGKRVPKNERLLNYDTGYPYIRVSDFKNDSISTKNIKFISKKVYDDLFNYRVKTNDIYISIAGTIGLVGLVPGNMNDMILTENAAKISCSNAKMYNDYLRIVLETNGLQNQIFEKTKGIGTPKLSLDTIRNLKIPVPTTLEEQISIVASVNKIKRGIEITKNEILDYESKNKQILKKFLS